MTVPSLDHLFVHIQSLWKSSFSDLCFATKARGGGLTVRLDDMVVGQIRFHLKKHECLHLGAINLIASRPGHWRQNHALALVDGQFALSSVIPGSEPLLEGGWSNGSNTPWITFHTCPEDNPAATLNLSSPVSLSRLEIENRGDEYAARAWGLVIDVRGSDGDWTTVYDAAERADAFVATLLAAYRHLPGEIPLAGELALTGRLLRLMFAGDLRGLEAALHDDEVVSHENKVFIQKNLGRLFLAPIDLDWTRHGIVRTFRYWTGPEKVEHLSDVMEIVRDLKALTPDVALGYGAVLSFVRERDLMPHDDDLDIILALPKEQFPTVTAALAQVEAHLRGRGYNVIGGHRSHRQVARPGKKDCDVFVGLIEGQFVSWFPGERGALNRADVFPPLEARLLGVKCDFPRNPFVYLDTVYGPSWATPLPGWSHNWDERGFLDVFGDAGA